MIKQLLSFFKPKHYDLYLLYDNVIKQDIVVDIITSALDVDKSMASYIYMCVKEHGQWCIASDKSQRKIDLLRHQLFSKGLKTYIEVN